MAGSERSARTTLELTLNPQYVKDWGVWEAIREFLQNALDGEDLGYDAEISYVTNTKLPQLRIVTNGVTIDRDTLLLGTTSKSGRADQRGEFGEGMKLACLVLVRNGLKVKIRSGEEQWVPRIDFSGNFNSDLLMVDTSPCVWRNSVQVDIIGLAPGDWESIQERVLRLKKPKKDEVIELGRNKILKGDRFKNKLFVKGIYVGRLPGNYYYGYDLSNVKLDRDRRLADPWDLKWEIRSTLSDAVEEKKLKVYHVMDILNGDYEESDAVAGYSYSDALSKQIAKAFQEEHGDKAIAVSDTASSIEAQHFGFKAIVVSKGIKALVDKELGDFESKKDERKFEVKNRYGADELSLDEAKNVLWAFKTVSEVEEVVTNITVVDFFDESILGLFKGGDIFVSKKIVANKVELISTVIHEAAHNYGGDGTNEHSDARDSIAAKIIVKLSE